MSELSFRKTVVALSFIFGGVSFLLFLCLYRDSMPAAAATAGMELNPVDYQYDPLYTVDFSDEYSEQIEAHFFVDVGQVRAGTEPLNTRIQHPSLRFVGYIETGETVVYAFRDSKAGDLFLLETGKESEGVTLVSFDEGAFVLEEDGGQYMVVLQ